METEKGKHAKEETITTHCLNWMKIIQNGVYSLVGYKNKCIFSDLLIKPCTKKLPLNFYKMGELRHFPQILHNCVVLILPTIFWVQLSSINVSMFVFTLRFPWIEKYFLSVVFESSYQIQVNSCFNVDKAEKVDDR